MTTTKLSHPDHTHIHNFQTGRPRFHFDEAGAGGGAAGADAGAAAAAAAKPWHDGTDTELIGHAQNKGWKLDSPKEAFAAAAKVARDLEKHFGAPPDRIVRLPTPDAKPEDLRAFYERLGAPKEAKEYDLSAIKDAAVADALRASVHARGVSKDAAAAIAADLAKALESSSTAKSTVDAQKLADQRAALAKNWGDKFEYNRLKAMEGAQRLGISPDAVKALEGLIGYDSVMEVMRKIGANTREDTFVERGVSGSGEVTTREGAVARKAELEGDKAWVGRYLAGGAAEKREMTRLNTMIAGVDA